MGIENNNNPLLKYWTQLDIIADGVLNAQDKFEMETKKNKNLSIYIKLEKSLGNVAISKRDFEEACEGSYNIDDVINNLKKKNSSHGSKPTIDLLSDKSVKNPLVKQAEEFANGYFEILKEVDNPILLIENYKKISGGNTLYSKLFASYNEGKISKEEFLNYLDILSNKFKNFEEECNKNKNDSQVKTYISSNYNRILSSIKNNISSQESMEQYYKAGRYDKNQILEIQKFLKKEYEIDLSETSISELTESCLAEQFTTFNFDSEQYCFDVEKFKSLCKNNESIIKDIKSTRFYAPSFYAISKDAEDIENEFGFFNFDVHNSKIANLALQSDKLIVDSNENIKIVKTSDKILLTNVTTNQQRTLDLNKITADLDESLKQHIKSLLNNMNNITLWEMAKEVNKSFKNDAPIHTGGKYYINDDHIGVNKNTSEYSLIHEMIHAMMATVIDGKNTFNEPLYKEFVETFERENSEHKNKFCIYSNSGYAYCASNIHEFAAESGCLYLTGHSESQFTIAEHYPQSYKIFVQLLETIRNQESGRTFNPS